MIAASGLAAPLRSRRSDLGVRTVTGLALLLIAVGCILVGRTPLWTLLTAAALAMLAEWSGMVGVARWQAWIACLTLAAALMLEQPNIGLPDETALAGVLAAALATLVLTRAPRLAAGLLYAGLPTVSLFFLSHQYDGADLVLWSMSCVWATDIGAYFAGRAIGGPRLAPAISPAKTWAGLIGGIVAAEAVGLSLAVLLDVQRRLAVTAGLLAIAAQAGDLYESAMKRRAGVKDSGAILPGHGGAMDRLDGVVPVACAVASLVALGWI